MDSPVRRYLEEERRAGTFPGASYLVARGSEIREAGYLGARQLVPEERPAAPDTLYDVASLTKPLVTGALCAQLASRGGLDLEAPLRERLPEAADCWLGSASLLDLLAHRSGLPAWAPLYLRASNREGYLREILSMPAEYRPRTRVVYSCLGYIVAALVLERLRGISLDRMAGEALFSPAGAADTRFLPPPSLRDRIAPTELGNAREREMAGPAGDGFTGWRTHLLQGECHDLNAWTLGGVSGNAGLFSTSADLHRLALEHLGEGRGVLDEPARRLLRTDLTPYLTENRSVGWQLAASPGSSAGPFLSPGAMGHTGFTGTSIWIDSEKGWILILLTNRVHPRYRPQDMNAVRRRFHQRALESDVSGASR